MTLNYKRRTGYLVWISLVVFAACSIIPLHVARADFPATLMLSPTTGGMTVNQTFNVDINLSTGGGPADGVDVYSLHFNPNVLEVIDSVSTMSGVQILPGNLFPNTVYNFVNNATGVIQFSQVAAGGTSFTGAGLLATVTFRAKHKGSTVLTFDFTQGSTVDTNVAYNGVDQLVSVNSGNYVVSRPRK